MTLFDEQVDGEMHNEGIERGVPCHGGCLAGDKAGMSLDMSCLGHCLCMRTWANKSGHISQSL